MRVRRLLLLVVASAGLILPGVGLAISSLPSVGAAPADAAGAVSGTPTTDLESGLDAGAAHSCAIASDGGIDCWGANSSGQATAPAGTFTAIATGSSHSCGLRTDASVACWGSDASGQAGGGGTAFGDQVIGLSAGGDLTCALAVDATITCRGASTAGQTTVPVGEYISVSAGGTYACAVRGEGTVTCWGDPTGGRTASPPGTFLSVSAGTDHACAVRTDGTVACWGANGFGQASAPTGTFLSVAAGATHSCGVRGNGTIACWGSAANGLAAPPSGSFVAVSGGDGFSCAVAIDGALGCWGDTSSSRTAAPSGSFRVASVSADGTTVCALRDGTADCLGTAAYSPESGWRTLGAGSPSCGIRGDGTIGCLDGASSFPSGTYRALLGGTCALRTDGTLACVDGAAPPSGEFRAGSASRGVKCAIRGDGSLACWGGSFLPVIDNNLSADAPAGAFRSVAVADLFGCAIRSTGVVACWGQAAQRIFYPALEDSFDTTFSFVLASGAAGLAMQHDGACVVTPAGALTRCAGGRNNAIADGGGLLFHWATPALPVGFRQGISDTGWACWVAPAGDLGCDTLVPRFTSGPPRRFGLDIVGYEHRFAATMSQGREFRITSGRLPDGLSLDPSGLVSGTPTELGTFPVTIEIVNSVLPLSQSVTFQVDLMDPPSVTIEQAADQPDPSHEPTVRFDVRFSQPVTGFTAADVRVAGTAAHGGTQVQGSGDTYTVTVPVILGTSGFISAAIPADVATNEAGDLNYAATSDDATVVVDRASFDSYGFTGAAQSFTVPDGICHIAVDANGASSSFATGLAGGRAIGVVDVVPGEVLTVMVGGPGERGSLDAVGGGKGGFNGGGAGGDGIAGPNSEILAFGGEGGSGATDLRRGAGLDGRLIVAGGGAPFAAGGGLTGGDGVSGQWAIDPPAADLAGKGGTQTAGGAAGAYSTGRSGQAGAPGRGGRGADAARAGTGQPGIGFPVAGSGGGGGWYGGGGGASYVSTDGSIAYWGGGGAGSGYGPAGTTFGLSATGALEGGLVIDYNSATAACAPVETTTTTSTTSTTSTTVAPSTTTTTVPASTTSSTSSTSTTSTTSSTSTTAPRPTTSTSSTSTTAPPSPTSTTTSGVVPSTSTTVDPADVLGADLGTSGGGADGTGATGAVTADGELPYTGGGSTWPVAQVGALIVVLGALLSAIAVRRTRRA